MSSLRPSRSSLSLSSLERFCHFVGQSLHGGQSFVESLRAYSRVGDWDAGPVADAVLQGDDAASALRKSARFPELLTDMVEVGEASGKLDQTFLRLADYYRELIRSQRVFQQGIFWPGLQLTAAAIVLSLLFLALDYLQRTVTVLVAPDLFGLGLQPLGNMAVVILVASIFLTMLGLLSWWSLQGRMPSPLFNLLRRLPGVGTTWKRIATSRFAWALGAAIDAGTDAVTAVRLALRSSSNPAYKNVERQLIQSLQNGQSFEQALAVTRKFPAELIQAVAVGESTGRVTECVQRLSQDYDEQNQVALRRLGQVSGMVVSLSVVVLLGFTVVSMYTRYMHMVSGALQANSQTLDEIRGALIAAPPANDELPNSPRMGIGQVASDSDNELIQTRDRMVEDFVENNEDFKKVQSIYSSLQRFNELTPNEFLDAIAGELPPPTRRDEPSTNNAESQPESTGLGQRTD